MADVQWLQQLWKVWEYRLIYGTYSKAYYESWAEEWADD